MNISAKFFSHYDNQLFNQVYLFDLLVKHGFETDKKCILSNLNFGIPVTTILLLMRDARDRLIENQNKFFEYHTQNSISHSDLVTEYKIFNKSNEITLNSEFTWEKHSCLNIAEPMISGSLGIVRNEILIPNDNHFNFPLYNHFGSSDNSIIVDYDKIIKIKSEQISDLELIRIYQDFTIFLEFSYAIAERLNEYEIKEFDKNFNSQIKVKQKQTFQSNNTRRGSLIHKNQLKFSIELDNTIKISNSKMIELVTDGFKDCCDWVDEIYGKMIDILKNKCV